MTEDRVGNIGKAIGTVIAVIILSLCIIAKAFGQENQPPSGQNSATSPFKENLTTPTIKDSLTVHSHTDASLQRFRLVRITSPAKVLYVEPNEKGFKVDYILQDRYEIENGSFQVTKET